MDWGSAKCTDPNKKIKFRTTNWNYSRQTTNIHGKNKNSRHYPEFVITRANCSRPKQIAHGKSQNGGQRFLVSGRPSTWCNTTRSTRPGRFPAFFGNVVIMFCSKCRCRSYHVLGRPLTKNRWPPPWLLPWAICFCREEFWIVSTVFVFVVNVCSLPEVISICCSEFYFVMNVCNLPGKNINLLFPILFCHQCL